MASGVEDLDIITRMVINLGGRMSTLDHFDEESTHLVTSMPLAREEKLLGSLAAGLWVLHPAYIKQSSEAGRFLPEENFEWGNKAALQHTHKTMVASKRIRDIANMCHWWRMEVASHGCAFKECKAVLLMVPSKTAFFERLIIAGGGKVVPFG
jgi:topoisomerase (DNA) II binding protein 1